MTDLTAADIAIKEGGKDRPVDSLKPATGPMHIALVEDGGYGAFQAAVAQFLERIGPRGQFRSIRSSGTILNVVHLLGAELDIVMGDGARQSGGRIEEAGSGDGIIPATHKIAESLQTQYAVTYTIPDGTELSDRIAVSTSRKGITLTAPTRISRER